jgi:hypothetical protein
MPEEAQRTFERLREQEKLSREAKEHEARRLVDWYSFLRGAAASGESVPTGPARLQVPKWFQPSK